LTIVETISPSAPLRRAMSSSFSRSFFAYTPVPASMQI
jgi:hypothetical protein